MRTSMMPDREKVIRAVGTCFDSWIDKHRNMGLDLHEVERLKREALELLKEQEPVIVLNIGRQFSCYSGTCPSCGKMLNTTCNKRYCGECGQAVKWDEL